MTLLHHVIFGILDIAPSTFRSQADYTVLDLCQQAVWSEGVTVLLRLQNQNDPIFAHQESLQT